MLELYISVVQLQGSTYFWVLLSKDKQYARSSNIDKKEIIMAEALEVANCLELKVIVDERPNDVAEIVKAIYPDLSLDYDDNLATDAAQFGLDAQGVAHVAEAPVSAPVIPLQTDDRQLTTALHPL